MVDHQEFLSSAPDNINSEFLAELDDDDTSTLGLIRSDPEAYKTDADILDAIEDWYTEQRDNAIDDYLDELRNEVESEMEHANNFALRVQREHNLYHIMTPKEFVIKLRDWWLQLDGEQKRVLDMHYKFPNDWFMEAVDKFDRQGVI